ncbi:MAG: DUF2076 domain-containing protein [Plesiomonas sp.]
MTPQEQNMIEGVADRLRNHTLSRKDPAAEALISEQIAMQPDALYRLTQSNILQEVALTEAKSKVAYLEEQLKAYRQQGMMERMRGATPVVEQPAPQYQPSMFGGFMKTAAAMTTGVVAGNLISDALSGLFSSRDEGMNAMNIDPQPVVENITNNFIDPANTAGLTSDDSNDFLANSDALTAMSNTDNDNPFGLDNDIVDPQDDNGFLDNSSNDDDNDFFDDDDDNNGLF